MTVDHRVFDADPATAKEPIAPRLSGLGDYGFKVTTGVPDSQAFFNQGWVTVPIPASGAGRRFVRVKVAVP